MKLSRDNQYFFDQALLALPSFNTPQWVKETDSSQPIFRTWSLETKLIEGNFESKKVCVGDKFKVTITFIPVVRLDKNIIVEFFKDWPIVMRGGKQLSFITGLSAWLRIQSAKTVIKAEDLIQLEITMTHECIGVFPTNTFKTIGQITCKTIKI